jgi:hypothetical protein
VVESNHSTEEVVMVAYRQHVWPRLRHQRTQQAGATVIYQVKDRLHKGRVVNVPASQVAATVSAWLAELGAHSPLVENLARAINSADWPATHAIGEHLAVDVTIAA